MFNTLDSPVLTAEHLLFRQQVRRFVEDEVKPHILEWEQAGRVPRSVLLRMGELGMLGVRFPEEYGGAGADTLTSVVFAEELGRSTCGGFAITVLTQTDTASPLLARSGSPAQLRKYLPKITSGESLAAIAMTEPDAGSDVAAIRTRARRDGDHYVLDGAKLYITNGVHADIYLVAAAADVAPGAKRGISLFIVEKSTPGLTVVRALDKMGWRCSDTAQLAFDGCRIPAENLLGDEGRGFYTLMKNCQNERLVLGAMAMGEAAAAIEFTLHYVNERQAFGKTLWSEQTIRQRLAMAFARVEAARQLIYSTAWMDAQGKECVKEVSMVKALCGELINEVLYTCQQFHGGYGYMTGTTIERMVRDARVHAIGGGATEVMLEQVAKRML